jgi:hypothetical protein
MQAVAAEFSGDAGEFRCSLERRIFKAVCISPSILKRATQKNLAASFSA